jgi:hypothetical protein
MRSVCVYCGSALGRREEFATAARDLGTALAERGLALVYGGGGIGLMGEVARAVVERGGRAIGIIPEHLHTAERAFHHSAIELRVTGSMHARKALMAELAGGSVVLPGGLGTLDELFEILTWRQLGLHRKPIGLLNVLGYFDPLLGALRAGVSEGFIPARSAEVLTIDTDPNRLIDSLATEVSRQGLKTGAD